MTNPFRPVTSAHYLSRRAATGTIDAARRLDPPGVALTGAALDDPPGVALDDPPGVTLDDSGATLELDAPGVTLATDGARPRALDPPGVTLGADGDRALICTVEPVADAERALGPAEFDVVLRCFVGGSSRSFSWGSTLTMGLGSPVMTAPLWSSGCTMRTFFGLGLRLPRPRLGLRGRSPPKSTPSFDP